MGSLEWYGGQGPVLLSDQNIGTADDVGFIYYDENFLSQDEAGAIRDLILEWEPVVKDSFPNAYAGAAPDALTGRHPFFNWLNVPEFYAIVGPKLQSAFRIAFPQKSEFGVQCWANTFRENEGIAWHKHEDETTGKFFCAHLFIEGDANDSATHYQVGNDVVAIPNKRGAFYVFDSAIYHAVALRKVTSTRISIAFDMLEYDANEKRFWRFHHLKF